MIGAYTKGKLRQYGYAGSGFSEKALKDAVERMTPFFTNKCPFVNPPNIKEKIQWVRPKLVCEVEYAELTADDQLWQTTFLGWRDDKKPREVVLEGASSQKKYLIQYATSRRDLLHKPQVTLSKHVIVISGVTD